MIRCKRCRGGAPLTCPVCRGRLDPVVLRSLEKQRGIVYHQFCRAVRWLWSPAGRWARFGIDLATLLLTLVLFGGATVWLGILIRQAFEICKGG